MTFDTNMKIQRRYRAAYAHAARVLEPVHICIDAETTMAMITVTALLIFFGIVAGYCLDLPGGLPQPHYVGRPTKKLIDAETDLWEITYTKWDF